MARGWHGGRTPVCSLATGIVGAGVVFLATPVGARSPGDPVRLTWMEGDIAGMSTIYDATGDTPIGFIEYHQRRRGDTLSSVRIARFRDGSSDEDRAEARVAGTLESIGGQSIIRDAQGRSTVDLAIDVEGGHLTGNYGGDAQRHPIEERVALPPGTYWGPLIFLVLKNFDANAEDGRVVFRTVAPTPRPLVLDMELRRIQKAAVDRVGTRIDTVQFELRPTIHWLVDPIVHLVAPTAHFWVADGEPPALARFSGPRNYARQPIVIQ